MKRIDRSALKRAIALTRAEDQGRREQIDAMLQDKNRTRQDVGKFCSMHRQMISLGCKPWQWPPCFIADLKTALRESPDELHKVRDAALLLEKMLAAGISKYHPDPLAALAEAERGTASA